MSKKLNPDRELVIQKYVVENKSLKEVGEYFGCSVTTISRYLDRYNIPRRNRYALYKERCHPPHNKYDIKKEFLLEEYVKNDKTIDKVAKEYGCAPSVICANLKAFGIKAKPKNSKKFLNLIKKEELEKRYLDAESYEDLARYFGVSISTITKYLNYYNIPLRGEFGIFNHRFGKKDPISKERLKNQWKDPIFRVKALIAPRTVEAQAKNTLAKQAFWLSESSLKLREKRAVDGRVYYENHKEHFVEAGKKGQASCPRISSVEIRFCKLLKQLGIDFVHQYKYKLGIADICVEPNKIIEVYGDYWHNYPNGREKDKKQIKYLKDNGYEVLVVWEHELQDIAKLKEKVINYIKGEICAI